LKICHIISGDLWAGAEVMAYQLIKGLYRGCDVSVIVVLLNEGTLADKLKQSGVRVFVIDEKRTNFINILKEVKKICRNYNPTIIHTHRYKENLLAYWAPRQGNKVKLVATQHGMPEPSQSLFNFKHKIIQKYNLRVLKRHFSRVVLVSEDIKNYFVNTLAFNNDKIKVIHNGIEILQDRGDKRRFKTFTVGSCGRLFPVKDYPFLIEVARECSTQKSNIHFILAGDGPGRGKLKALVEKYGLNGSFEFLGHVENMHEFYKGLDLYINTSLHEGIPMSVLEAMSYGLPVIAPRVGGLPEIIEDGAEGFLIDTRDPRTFSKKCLLLANDRALWQKMSRAALEKVTNHFSVSHMVEKYLTLYDKLPSFRGRNTYSQRQESEE